MMTALAAADAALMTALCNGADSDATHGLACAVVELADRVTAAWEYNKASDADAITASKMGAFARKAAAEIEAGW